MTLLTMYDAVTAANLPADAKYVCFYTDGQFANGTAVKQRCPHATYLSITVRGGVADCCDCEQGDLTVAEAETWVARRLAAGQYRPCVYANLDRWERGGLKAGLAKYGARIRRWVADYDNVAVVPSGFDAKQYRSTSLLDTSVCLPGFFAPKPAPVPPPPPPTSKPQVQPQPAPASTFNPGFQAGWRAGIGWLKKFLHLK